MGLNRFYFENIIHNRMQCLIKMMRLKQRVSINVQVEILLEKIKKITKNSNFHTRVISKRLVIFDDEVCIKN